MHGFGTPKNWDGVWNPVLGKYRLAFAWTHVLHMLRYAFDDVNREEGKDWFRPFVAAMCAWEEHQFRKSLGMPPSLGDDDFDASMRSIVLSTFADRVLEGAQYPDLEWEKDMADVLKTDVDI